VGAIDTRLIVPHRWVNEHFDNVSKKDVIVAFGIRRIDVVVDAIVSNWVVMKKVET